jgi:hypothetical protein
MSHQSQRPCPFKFHQRDDYMYFEVQNWVSYGTRKGYEEAIAKLAAEQPPMVATTSQPKTFDMTMDEYRDAGSNFEGRCIACGAEVPSGCEPDARRYECEECGEKQVYGMDELLIMGLINIEEVGDE